jgi:tRNA pseudouridine38-40 synthase
VERGELTIQSTLQEALRSMTGETLAVVGSGRTDAGVHALAQVAHFTLESESSLERDWTPRKFFLGLNSRLPPSIRVQNCAEVSLEFHAQHSVLSKQYSYHYFQGAAPIPHLAPYSWWLRKPLDVEAMHEAVQPLLGRHDFHALQAAGGGRADTSREILGVEVLREPISFPGEATLRPDLSLVRFRIEGTGFLKQMVRSLAGTLVQIGEGRRKPSDLMDLIEARDRSRLGKTAPAQGLWLEKVTYPQGLLSWPK